MGAARATPISPRLLKNSESPRINPKIIATTKKPTDLHGSPANIPDVPTSGSNATIANSAAKQRTRLITSTPTRSVWVLTNTLDIAQVAAAYNAVTGADAEA